MSPRSPMKRPRNCRPQQTDVNPRCRGGPPKPISKAVNRATSQPGASRAPGRRRSCIGRAPSRQRWLHETEPEVPERRRRSFLDPAKPDELAVAGPGDDLLEPDGHLRDEFPRRRRWWRLRTASTMTHDGTALDAGVPHADRAVAAAARTMRRRSSVTSPPAER